MSRALPGQVRVPCNRGCGREVTVPEELAKVFGACTCDHCMSESDKRPFRSEPLPGEVIAPQLESPAPPEPAHTWHDNYEHY